jgi:hypothetical protein
MHWLYIQDRNNTTATFSEASKTKFNLNKSRSFGQAIYSYIKLMCYEIEPPKYSYSIEMDPGATMNDKNIAKNIEKIKKQVRVSTNCLQKNFESTPETLGNIQHN